MYVTCTLITKKEKERDIHIFQKIRNYIPYSLHLDAMDGMVVQVTTIYR